MTRIHEAYRPGIKRNHFGLQVANMEAVRERFVGLGADVSEIRSGGTKAILSNVTELNGHRIELSEYPADSLQGKFLQY